MTRSTLRSHPFSLHIRLPADRHLSFLAREVGPRVASLVEKGDLLRWYLESSGGEHREGQSLCRLRWAGFAASAPAAGRIAESLTAQLARPLRDCQGEWIEPPERAGNHDRERLGGDEGIAIFEDFLDVDTRLLLEIGARAPARQSPVQRQKLALTSIFFLAARLDIRPRRRRYWMETWVRSLAQLQAEPESWLKAVAGQARELYESSTELRDFLGRLAREDWGDLTPVLDPFVAPVTKIGARLRRIEDALARIDQPFGFAVFLSYIHTHLLTLGFDNLGESVLTQLASLAYEEGALNHGNV